MPVPPKSDQITELHSTGIFVWCRLVFRFSSPPGQSRLLLKSLGPGVITGAADDDPSGIATYSVEMTDAARVFYTAGLMDGFYASALFGATDKTVANLHLCTKDMDSKQVSAIITKYVKDHPESWHLPLSVEGHNALNAACPG